MPTQRLLTVLHQIVVTDLTGKQHTHALSTTKTSAHEHHKEFTDPRQTSLSAPLAQNTSYSSTHSCQMTVPPPSHKHAQEPSEDRTRHLGSLHTTITSCCLTRSTLLYLNLQDAGYGQAAHGAGARAPQQGLCTLRTHAEVPARQHCRVLPVREAHHALRREVPVAIGSLVGFRDPVDFLHERLHTLTARFRCYVTAALQQRDRTAQNMRQGRCHRTANHFCDCNR